MTSDFARSCQRNKVGIGTWEHRAKVAIAGYGYSPLDRRWDGVSMDRTLGAFQVMAMQKAIADAGLTSEDIDGLMVCPEPGGDPWGQEDRGLNRPFFDPPYDSEDGLSYTSA